VTHFTPTHPLIVTNPIVCWKQARSDALAGKRIVFTGQFSEILRDEAKKLAEAFGGCASGVVGGVVMQLVIVVLRRWGTQTLFVCACCYCSRMWPVVSPAA